MTRRERIENKGYKITLVMSSGNYYAVGKFNNRYVGTSISDLHKQIFGY